jgi:hypothetical protein
MASQAELRDVEVEVEVEAENAAVPEPVVLYPNPLTPAVVAMCETVTGARRLPSFPATVATGQVE